MIRGPLVAILRLSASAAFAAEKIVKKTFTSESKARTYYLFVPDSGKDSSVPLLILLHGSGPDGEILDHGESMAKKEGIRAGRARLRDP